MKSIESKLTYIWAKLRTVSFSSAKKASQPPALLLFHDRVYSRHRSRQAQWTTISFEVLQMKAVMIKFEYPANWTRPLQSAHLQNGKHNLRVSKAELFDSFREPINSIKIGKMIWIFTNHHLFCNSEFALRQWLLNVFRTKNVCF